MSFGWTVLEQGLGCEVIKAAELGRGAGRSLGSTGMEPPWVKMGRRRQFPAAGAEGANQGVAKETQGLSSELLLYRVQLKALRPSLKD